MATSLVTNVILRTAWLDGSLDRSVVVGSIGGFRGRGTGDDEGTVAEEGSRAMAADGVLFRVEGRRYRGIRETRGGHF